MSIDADDTAVVFQSLGKVDAMDWMEVKRSAVLSSAARSGRTDSKVAFSTSLPNKV